jgi:hypothetical protein
VRRGERRKRVCAYREKEKAEISLGYQRPASTGKGKKKSPYNLKNEKKKGLQKASFFLSFLPSSTSGYV